MNWSQESGGTSGFSPSSSSGSSSGGESQGLPGAICSSLPFLPFSKLTDMDVISQGVYGTVCKARHSDWRIPVAVKYIQIHRPMEIERSIILKEAEILHRARFNYILQILGICNEPAFLGIVTEYMTNGSLDQLLFRKQDYPDVPYSLRFRIIYEIALGVNFLHNMNPPLLHHDLKAQNILLDNEFHVKIADFGLSQWRKLSSSQSTMDTSSGGGTVIYMPPENYEPSKKTRASVKHDIYSYAIIMWEVFSRKPPFEDATNPVQIMFTVSKGTRPDTSEEALPLDIPHREVIISVMTCGWAQNPDERPSFLKCLLDIEPIASSFDELSILEAVLKIKTHKMRNNLNPSSGSSVCQAPTPEREDRNIPVPEKEEDNTNIKLTHMEGLRDGSVDENVISPVGDGSTKAISPHGSSIPCSSTDNGGLYHFSSLRSDLQQPSDVSLESTQQGVAYQWIQSEREDLVSQMTEACLNQCLDALLSKLILMNEDYELITARPTRTSKVRQLIDTCRGEDFARIIVQKLKDNKQMGLQPFPDISLENQTASYLFKSVSNL